MSLAVAENTKVALLDDEISLIGLALVIVSRKYTFLTVFIAFFCLGLLAAIFGPKYFLYSTTIELGSYALPNRGGDIGKRNDLESAQQVEQKIKNHYISKVSQSWVENYPELDLPTINVSVPASSSIVVVSTKGKKDDVHLKKLINDVASLLVSNHEIKMEGVLEQIRRQFDSLFLDYAKLDNEFKELTERKEFISNEVGVTDRYKDHLTAEVEKLEKELKDFRQLKLTMSGENFSEIGLLDVFVIDTEIRQLTERLAEHEQKLLYQLPKTRNELAEEIEVIKYRLNVADQARSGMNALLTRFGVSRSSMIDSVESQEKVEKLLNINPTRIVVPAFRSLKPINLSSVAIFVIVVLCGFCMAIIMCFVMDFIAKVKAAQLLSDSVFK